MKIEIKIRRNPLTVLAEDLTRLKGKKAETCSELTSLHDAETSEKCTFLNHSGARKSYVGSIPITRFIYVPLTWQAWNKDCACHGTDVRPGSWGCVVTWRGVNWWPGEQGARCRPR